MSALGVHALVWTGRMDAAAVRDAADRTLAAGYDILELPLLDPFAFDVDGVKRALADLPIRITGSLGLAPATDISSERPGAVAAGERLLHRAVDVLAELGSTDLVGVIYGAM